MQTTHREPVTERTKADRDGVKQEGDRCQFLQHSRALIVPGYFVCSTRAAYSLSRPPHPPSESIAVRIDAAPAPTLEATVFEVHPRPTVGGGRESNLDLARLCEVRLVAPLVGNLPRKHNPMRRLPDEHLPPVAVGAVVLLRVAAAASFAFYDALLHRRLADMVR